MNDMNLGFTLPSSQKDREKIRKMLEECSGQLQMIDDRKNAVKELIASVAEEFDIPKKILSKAATAFFKNNYAELSSENTIFEILYEGVLSDASMPATAPVSDND